MHLCLELVNLNDIKYNLSQLLFLCLLWQVILYPGEMHNYEVQEMKPGKCEGGWEGELPDALSSDQLSHTWQWRLTL